MMILDHQLESAKGRGGRNRYMTLRRVQARVDLYGGLCFYCGDPADTLEHRIPVAARPSNGVVNFPSNIVPACRSCNSSKGTYLVTEWLASEGS